jgi:hypothetical protein
MITVDPGYKDVGLYGISYISSHIMLYYLTPNIVVLPGYNDTSL